MGGTHLPCSAGPANQEGIPWLILNVLLTSANVKNLLNSAKEL